MTLAVADRARGARTTIPVKYQNAAPPASRSSARRRTIQITSGLTVAEGRFLLGGGMRRRPAGVRHRRDLATNLFRRRIAARPENLRRTAAFEVVGVLEKQGGFGDSGGADNDVMVPLAQFTALYLAPTRITTSR